MVKAQEEKKLTVEHVFPFYKWKLRMQEREERW